MKLFVYGTLKRGFPANHRLNGCTYLRDATIFGYSMYNIGRYPGIVPGSESASIEGELYDVPEEKIPELDWYEGHPDLYVRTPVPNTDIEVYVYNKSVEGLERIPTGNYT